MTRRKLILLLLLMLMGCNPTPVSNISTSEPNPTINLSPASGVTLLTPTQTSTPTSTPQSLIKFQCLDIKKQSSDEITAIGMLVFASDYSATSVRAFMLNLATGEKIFLPAKLEEIPGSFAISPDFNQLAYIAQGSSKDNSRLLVVNQTGSILFEKPISTLEWSGIVKWLDNEKLLIDKVQKSTDGYSATPAPVIVLNINDGSITEYSPKYPNIYKSDLLRTWERYATNETVYDPGMNFVVYPDKDGNLIFWDRHQNHEISRLISANGFGYGPRWSPDGTKFISDIYVGEIVQSKQPWFEPEKLWKEELFIVTKDGTATKLTDLTQEYSDVDLGPYSWSPDGANIAFWVRVKPDQMPDLPVGASWVRRLAILNMQTQNITFYCIQGDINGQNSNGGKYSRVAEPPIWSPQGDKLLVEISNGDKGNMVIVVDLFTNKTERIAEELIPLGWLNTNP